MVSKVDKSGELPTVEVVRHAGPHIYTEEVVDWRRVEIVDGEKVIRDEPV